MEEKVKKKVKWIAFWKFRIKPDIVLAERKNYLKHILFKLPFKLQWHRTFFFPPDKGIEEAGN